MNYHLDHLPDLPEVLISRVRQIPLGRVSTYGRLAASLGNAIAARWVASFLLRDDRAARCASHRVVRADGSPGGYAGDDPRDKIRRLQAEGIALVEGCVPLDDFLFHELEGPRPLEDLRREQDTMKQRINLKNVSPRPSLVGGVDVSYFDNDRGVAAFALVDGKSGELLWSTTVAGQVEFPYISSYLAYRELPLARQVVEKARRAGRVADVLMVDGSGVLHPRGIGVASQLGLACGLPTIGVTKKSLTGQLDSSNVPLDRPVAIRVGRRKLGWAMRPRATSKKLIYVSPGHGVTVDSSRRLAWRMLRGRSLPEPIYWADRLSRAEAKHHGGTP